MPGCRRRHIATPGAIPGDCPIALADGYGGGSAATADRDDMDKMIGKVGGDDLAGGSARAARALPAPPSLAGGTRAAIGRACRG